MGTCIHLSYTADACRASESADSGQSGPATYIISCPYGCDVRAMPDVNSELITRLEMGRGVLAAPYSPSRRLAKGDKVEIACTQDYIAGPTFALEVNYRNLMKKPLVLYQRHKDPTVLGIQLPSGF